MNSMYKYLTYLYLGSWGFEFGVAWCLRAFVAKELREVSLLTFKMLLKIIETPRFTKFHQGIYLLEQRFLAEIHSTYSYNFIEIE